MTIARPVGEADMAAIAAERAVLVRRAGLGKTGGSDAGLDGFFSGRDAGRSQDLHPILGGAMAVIFSKSCACWMAKGGRVTLSAGADTARTNCSEPAGCVMNK